jgi:hypothetical protein
MTSKISPYIETRSPTPLPNEACEKPFDGFEACRFHPRLRTYRCDAANRRDGPQGDITVLPPSRCEAVPILVVGPA